MQDTLISSWGHWYVYPADVYHLELSTYQKLVYIYLCSRANEDSRSWPAVDTISQATGCSKRTVQRAIKTLQKLGLLVVTPRYGENGRQTSNLYVINAPNCRGEGDTVTWGGCHSDRGEGVTVTPELLTERSISIRTTTTNVVVGNQDLATIKKAYKQKTGLDDLPESVVGEWIKRYGTDYVQQKIAMIPSNIRKPAAWLNKAVSQNWQPAEDKVLELEKRKQEQTKKLLEEVEQMASKHDPAKTAARVQELLKNLRKSEGNMLRMSKIQPG